MTNITELEKKIGAEVSVPEVQKTAEITKQDLEELDQPLLFRGEEVKLKLGGRAVFKLATEHNIKLSDFQSRSEDMSFILTLVWAGLLHLYPEITLEEVLDDFEDMSFLIPATLQIADAITVKGLN